MKRKFELKTFIPIFILGLITELLIFAAYQVNVITPKKIIALFVVVCVCASVLTIIPFVQRLVQAAGVWVKNLPKTISTNKKSIIKSVILLLVVSVLAILGSMLLLKIHPVKVAKYVLPGMYALSWTVCFVLVFGITQWEKLVKNLEGCVAILIILIGIVYICAEPATLGNSWDDGNHYSIAMNKSYNFEMFAPKVELDLLDSPSLGDDKFDTSVYDKWANSMEKEYRKPTNCLDSGYTPSYKSIAYIPSAVLLLLGRAFQLPFLMVMRLGKLGFVLTFALAVYLSMKKLEGGKMIAAAIALLPEVLFLASNYSYDAWVIGWLMLGMSCFIYELQHIENKIDKKNIALMLVAFFLGLGPKAIFVPIVCLALFMPSEKFESKKQQRIYRAIVMAVILCILSTFLIPFIGSSGGGAGDTRGGSDVNASAQTSFILNNLGEYLVICWNYFKDYVALSNWYSMTSFLAYMGEVPFQITSVVLLFVVAFTDKCAGDKNFMWYHRIVLAILSVGTTVLVITALYIAYTPVASETVLGCQPRYILPLFFPVLYCIGSSKIENKTNVIAYRGVILSLSTFIVLYGIWTAIICKYI